MTKNHDTKKFLKRLNMNQFKTLIALCVIECDRARNSMFYQSLFDTIDDITLECSTQKEWDMIDYVHIRARIGKVVPSTPYFLVDDLSLQMNCGCSSGNFNLVLNSYLTNVFGEEYANYVFDSRVNAAMEEKKNLLMSANDICDTLGHKFSVVKKLEKK